jgi:hypothetical protein
MTMSEGESEGSMDATTLDMCIEVVDSVKPKIWDSPFEGAIQSRKKVRDGWIWLIPVKVL